MFVGQRDFLPTLPTVGGFGDKSLGGAWVGIVGLDRDIANLAAGERNLPGKLVGPRGFVHLFPRFSAIFGPENRCVRIGDVGIGGRRDKAEVSVEEEDVKGHSRMVGDIDLLPSLAKVIADDHRRWSTDSANSNDANSRIQLAGVDVLFTKNLHGAQSNDRWPFDRSHCIPGSSAVGGFVERIGVGYIWKVARADVPSESMLAIDKRQATEVGPFGFFLELP